MLCVYPVFITLKILTMLCGKNRTVTLLSSCRRDVKHYLASEKHKIYKDKEKQKQIDYIPIFYSIVVQSNEENFGFETRYE